MNILIMGAPGSGKGTMSSRIVEKYGLTHISTGDIFRSEIKNETELGLTAKSYIEKGLLVPDSVTNPMVVSFLEKNNLENGYLLDGYPRTLSQAEVYSNLVQNTNLEIDLVINLEVDYDVIKERITGRWMSPEGKIYHVKFNPPLKEGICDISGSPLFQRKDDTLESVVVRLEEYDKNTKPVLDFYNQLGKLVNIDGDRPMDEVFADIEKLLEKK